MFRLLLLLLISLSMMGDAFALREQTTINTDFTLHLNSEDWGSEDCPGRFKDDLVIFNDGTQLWGQVGWVPPIHYSFGQVNFELRELGAIAFSPNLAEPKMQIVTRNGQNYIGSMDFRPLSFSQRHETKENEECERSRIIVSYEEIELNPEEINVIIFRHRGGSKPLLNCLFYSMVFRNGDRFPFYQLDDTIPLYREGREFQIKTNEISEIEFRGGLQGYLKGESLDVELPFSLVQKDTFGVRLGKNGQCLQIPWDQIDRIMGDMGSFVICTPYRFNLPVDHFMDMVLIPEGRFYLGTDIHPTEGTGYIPELASPRPVSIDTIAQVVENSNPSEGISGPSVLVEMPSFYIDKYEVTNAQYAQFVAATDHRAPPHWDHGMVPDGMEGHPVVNVSFEDAQAYAAWVGKRLPTEVEWERAAKGASGFLYPYGPEYDPTMANTNSHGTEPVGSYEAFMVGRPYDTLSSQMIIQDMSGNVAEWTSTSYQAGWYSELKKKGKFYNPQNRVKTPFKVLRGGSYASGAETSSTSYREALHQQDYNPRTGFRCVKDIH